MIGRTVLSGAWEKKEKLPLAGNRQLHGPPPAKKFGESNPRSRMDEPQLAPSPIFRKLLKIFQKISSMEYPNKQIKSFQPAAAYFPPEGVSSALPRFTSLFGMGRGSSMASSHRMKRFNILFKKKFVIHKRVF